MDAAQVLSTLRPLVLVVDGLGTITSAHGGFGGFLGHDLDALRGASVFDFVAPAEADDLAMYFVESGGESLRTVSLSLPFRVTLVGADGLEHPVDVIPTGIQEDGEETWSWVVVIVPVSLNTSISRSLDAEMAGSSRSQVKKMLSEELSVDNDSYSSRWFLVDLTDHASPSVSTSRSEAQPMARALDEAMNTDGWVPWNGIVHGDSVPLSVDDLPTSVSEIAIALNWRRVTVTPVMLDGVVVAAYVGFGSVPDDFDVTVVKANVKARVSGLADVTALLIARWRERDKLQTAATRDSLTGLANRDSFSDALDRVHERSALLYIDVDRFKSVNDRFGHDVGDQVLVHVADRIVSACRPDDVVARFGGDEFVVLLNGVDASLAESIGERIVKSVGAPMLIGDELAEVNVSVGLASIHGGDDDDVISAADRAMLQAKRNGRGRLVSAGIPAS